MACGNRLDQLSVPQHRVQRSQKRHARFFVDLPGKDGLLHVSRISNKRVEKVTDVLNVGDTVTVKCYEIDDKGRVNLTRKGLEDTPIIKA